MKLNSLLILVLSCTACINKSSENIILQGKLGKNVESEIILEQEGDKFSGHFLNLTSNEKITLRGVKEHTKLRLEEYNTSGKNKLTGIFEGTFDGTTYEGFWRDPAGKSKVRFQYKVEIQEENETESGQQISTTVQAKDLRRIKLSYHKWVDEMVANGENWYEKDWLAYYKKWEGKDKYETNEYMDNCKDGLPEDFEGGCFGDINGDGIIDAWTSIFPSYCMEGTWQINADFGLYFISKPDGTYTVLYEPVEVFSEIGVAGHVDTIYPDGLILYRGVDYKDSDAHCCPSKEWQVRFRYQGGQFVKVKK